MRSFVGTTSVHFFAVVFSAQSFAGSFFCLLFQSGFFFALFCGDFLSALCRGTVSEHFLAVAFPCAPSRQVSVFTLSQGLFSSDFFRGNLLAFVPEVLPSAILRVFSLRHFAGGFPVRFSSGTSSVRSVAAKFSIHIFAGVVPVRFSQAIFPFAFLHGIFPCAFSLGLVPCPFLRRFFCPLCGRDRFSALPLKNFIRTVFGSSFFWACFGRCFFCGLSGKGFFCGLLRGALSVLSFGGSFINALLCEVCSDRFFPETFPCAQSLGVSAFILSQRLFPCVFHGGSFRASLRRSIFRALFCGGLCVLSFAQFLRCALWPGLFPCTLPQEIFLYALWQWFFVHPLAECLFVRFFGEAFSVRYFGDACL